MNLMILHPIRNAKQRTSQHCLWVQCTEYNLFILKKILYPMSTYEFSVYYIFGFRTRHYKQLLMWKVNGLNLVNHYWKDNELFGMSNITIQALKIILFLFAFYIILFLFYFYPKYSVCIFELPHTVFFPVYCSLLP